jgi:hypothetical protein
MQALVTRRSRQKTPSMVDRVNSLTSPDFYPLTEAPVLAPRKATTANMREHEGGEATQDTEALLRQNAAAASAPRREE